MKNRPVLFWTLTLLFAALMLVDGVAGLLRLPDGEVAMRQLGYPVYLLSIVGLAKVLGALALAQPWLRTLKEWAFAGFTINFLGAAASWALAGQGAAFVLPPLVMLALLLGLYAFWKRQEKIHQSSAAPGSELGPLSLLGLRPIA